MHICWMFAHVCRLWKLKRLLCIVIGWALLHVLIQEQGCLWTAFRSTSVPVPCRCNGFASIMQNWEEKTAERVHVHVWEKIGSDRCSVHRFAHSFRGHDRGTRVWIGAHVNMKACTFWWTDAELRGPHQSLTEWRERFAPLFLWWLPVSYFPGFRPHTFDYPHPFPASSLSLLYPSLSHTLSLFESVWSTSDLEVSNEHLW